MIKVIANVLKAKRYHVNMEELCKKNENLYPGRGHPVTKPAQDRPTGMPVGRFKYDNRFSLANSAANDCVVPLRNDLVADASCPDETGLFPCSPVACHDPG